MQSKLQRLKAYGHHLKRFQLYKGKPFIVVPFICNFIVSRLYLFCLYSLLLLAGSGTAAVILIEHLMDREAKKEEHTPTFIRGRYTQCNAKLAVQIQITDHECMLPH